MDSPGFDQAPTSLDLGGLPIGGCHTKPGRALVEEVVGQVDGTAPVSEADDLRVPLLQQTREPEAKAARNDRRVVQREIAGITPVLT